MEPITILVSAAPNKQHTMRSQHITLPLTKHEDEHARNRGMMQCNMDKHSTGSNVLQNFAEDGAASKASTARSGF